MHKPQNYEIRYKLIFFWLLINSCLAVIIASLISIGMKESFYELLLINFLTTHIVALMAVASGYACGYFLHDYSLGINIPVNLAVTLIATYCGMQISLFTGRGLESGINYTLMIKIIDRLMLPVLIITGIISTLTVFIEDLKYKRVLLMGSLNELQNKITYIESIAKEDSGFVFKENERPIKISYDSIIFLSSAGKKSMIHTELRDYEVSQLLKEINDSLPQKNFIRIHKQYIVNVGYILQMKYYKGEDISFISMMRMRTSFL